MSIFDNIECKKHEEVKLIGGYALCIVCGVCRPLQEQKHIPLRPIHRITLKGLFEVCPREIRSNRTAFMYSEIFRYIYEKKVVRFRTMGETRGGKSEMDQTIALNYIIIFNALHKKGHFKNIKITYPPNPTTGEVKEISVIPLTLTVDHIHANQSAYLYSLRDTTRAENLLFGQNHIIDEDRENPGGIGSFSEEMEEENANNIVAKFMQSEFWIKPTRFENTNTPYGINCYIKDEKNKMNWGLLYKIEMQSEGLQEQNFIGWVGISLHDDEELRKAYNKKKDVWIMRELKGGNNERQVRRIAAIEEMLRTPEFIKFKITKSGEFKWSHGIEEMKFLVENAIREEKIDPFNETEIERIVYGARVLGEQRLKPGSGAV